MSLTKAAPVFNQSVNGKGQLKVLETKVATGVRNLVIQYKPSDFYRLVFSGINVGSFEVYEDDMISGFLDAVKRAESAEWPVRSLFDSVGFEFVDNGRSPIQLDFAPQGPSGCFGEVFLMMLKKLETNRACHLRRLIQSCGSRVQTIHVNNVALKPEDTDKVLSCLLKADERFCAYTTTAPGYSATIALGLTDGEAIEIELIFPSPRVENYELILPDTFWKAVPNLHVCVMRYASLYRTV